MKKTKRLLANPILSMIIFAMMVVAGIFSLPINVAASAKGSAASYDNTTSYHDSITEREFWQRQSSKGQFFSTDMVAQTTGKTGLFKSQLTGKALEIYELLENAAEKETLTSKNPGITVTMHFSPGQDYENQIEQYTSVYDKALFAYEYDHLEQFFWQDGNSVSCKTTTITSRDDIQVDLTFSYSVSKYYTYDLEVKAKAKLADVVTTAKTKDTVYDKLVYLNEWLCNNCTYDYDALNASEYSEQSYYAHTSMGCLILGKGVCETYAKTLKLLCQELEIPCLVVNSETHAFNYVKMENELWYMIDCTWNDSGDYPENYMKYFLISNNPYIDQDDHYAEGELSFPYTSTKTYAEDTKDPAEEPDKEPVEEPDKEPTEEPDKEPTEEPDKEPVEEPIKTYPRTISISPYVYTYDGKVKTPVITVKDNLGKPISGKYFLVKYPSGRKNVGKYPVIVTFRDIYSEQGSYTCYFTINPPNTTIRGLTAKSKGFTIKWDKKPSQVTGYQIQYSTSSNFKSGTKTITVGSYKTVSKTITKLKAKKKYYVRIRTYKSGKPNLYSSWSTVKSVKTK